MTPINPRSTDSISTIRTTRAGRRPMASSIPNSRVRSKVDIMEVFAMLEAAAMNTIARKDQIEPVLHVDDPAKLRRRLAPGEDLHPRDCRKDGDLPGQVIGAFGGRPPDHNLMGLVRHCQKPGRSLDGHDHAARLDKVHRALDDRADGEQIACRETIHILPDEGRELPLEKPTEVTLLHRRLVFSFFSGAYP